MQVSTNSPVPDIRYLKGIGPRRADTLKKVGVSTLRDLFYYFPRRYEDRSVFKSVSDIVPGEPVTLKGRVLSVTPKRLRGLTLLEVWLGDENGMIPAVWFNQHYLSRQFKEGQLVILYGKPEIYHHRLQLNGPEFEIIDEEETTVHTGRITPIYPLTEGLYQKTLRSILHQALTSYLPQTVFEFLPGDFRQARNFPGLAESLRNVHFPESLESLEHARRRLVFDEFFIFELLLIEKTQQMRKKYKARAFPGVLQTAEAFRKTLPFQLTSGQEEAVQAIAREVTTEHPMNRLLMGDVGSGKTVIAAFLMAAAAREGFQAALLVPTEILAQQHYRTLQALFQSLKIPVKLLTSSTPSAAREKMLAEMAQGKISCVVGTHALLVEDVRFKDLAAVIVDEQHKFGVYQRSHLLHRDPRPHQLVMTATPIPRTLALTVYGDLDVSSIRTLPPGRQPIKTFWTHRKMQPKVFEHILEKLRRGEQAYFIYPIIEETERSDMLAATKGYEILSRGPFKEIRSGLVHGRMSSEEREGVMRDFKDGKIQLLVATSVIEVGVDNPNATMMVIENAERFGLSQLHQMRGRIGRGEKLSECFLFGDPTTDEGWRRLRILTRVQDGFAVAEEDLKIRGPGDFWGTRQSGEPLFRLANPLTDQDLLVDARETALEIVQRHELRTSPRWDDLKKLLDHLPIRY